MGPAEGPSPTTASTPDTNPRKKPTRGTVTLALELAGAFVGVVDAVLAASAEYGDCATDTCTGATLFDVVGVPTELPADTFAVAFVATVTALIVDSGAVFADVGWLSAAAVCLDVPVGAASTGVAGADGEVAASACVLETDAVAVTAVVTESISALDSPSEPW